jgi:hypothetical protein
MPTNDSYSFFNTGALAAKFEDHGDTVSGAIVEPPEMRQQIDPVSKKPKFWDDGKPRNELLVKLQTSVIDNADDDGVRRVYVRGQMTQAIAKAIRAAGARGLDVDGVLSVTYTADGERKGALNAPKLYEAKYEPPAGPDDNPPDLS